MTINKVLICPCPDLKIDLRVLQEYLARGGLAARLPAPLCTPAGLKELKNYLASEPEGLLIAACGPEVNADLFRRVFGEKAPPVIDLLSISDPETAAGVLTLACAAPPEAAPRPAPASRDVLVVGGGIGGCQAALDLADAGHRVYLVDSSLSIGGTMAQLDKTFPTLDCSICILGPRLVEVATHNNIELLTFADLDSISGRAGAFEVTVTLKPRYVDMAKCVGCGSCAEVCPVIVPSRWNLGLKPRKCIRIIFAQAVPLSATLEKEYCIDCQMCVAACDHQAIDLGVAPVKKKLAVGAVILATGARPLDPAVKSEYGYGRIPRVLTALEYERLVCATGPTGGSLIAPDGTPVKSLAFIQCVGSRDRRFLPYCSGICCTASIKEAMLALEHDPEIQATIFFNDIRTSGKGFEELYLRAKKAGVRFIKGLPGRVEADALGRPVIHYDDQQAGQRAQLTVDLAVLAAGLQAPKELPVFEEAFPERDAFGFLRGRHPTLYPVDSTLPGVFLAGTCQGPQDISETVCQGSAAAARVMRLLSPKNKMTP
ncbi:MAG: CoB--CoM heterodisulfide reductase iron-sulfur subunit A family protein [Deltaproteobacteria bacterium]|nr:CoB--CoM heterodisulfide reductase iron-sulfur subunit A family protein [Deltaproteobacteria bacterium]